MEEAAAAAAEAAKPKELLKPTSAASTAAGEQQQQQEVASPTAPSLQQQEEESALVGSSSSSSNLEPLTLQPDQTQAAAPASLALSSDLLIQESWRVVVLVEDVPAWLGVRGVYQGLSNMFRGADPSVICVTWDHRRPYEVSVDFDSAPARNAFAAEHKDRFVVIPGIKARVRLRVAKYNGPTEQDWLVYYGRPKDASTPLADTVVLRNVPGHWFDIHDGVDRADYMAPDSPLRAVLRLFGTIRDMNVEVHASKEAAPPEAAGAAGGAADGGAPRPLTHAMGPLLTVFDVWVRFREYDDFVAAMSAFSNCSFIHRSGEACACNATFDREEYFSEFKVRRRAAAARVALLQEKIRKKEAAKRIKHARQRVAHLKRNLKRKVKRMATQYEFIGSMSFPRGTQSVIDGLARARDAMRAAYAACEEVGVKVSYDIEEFLASVSGEKPKGDGVMDGDGGEEVGGGGGGGSAQAGRTGHRGSRVSFGGASTNPSPAPSRPGSAAPAIKQAGGGGGGGGASSRPLTAVTAATATTLGTSAEAEDGEGGGGSDTSEVNEVEALEAFTVKPALKAVNAARWALKAAETAADEAITEANQRLPTVAEALVTIKALRFLEVLRNHHPPLDVSGKTIFVVKDSGLLDASADPDDDPRFQPPPKPHTHPFHEPQCVVGVLFWP